VRERNPMGERFVDELMSPTVSRAFVDELFGALT
jgi:hypothetical protein